MEAGNHRAVGTETPQNTCVVDRADWWYAADVFAIGRARNCAQASRAVQRKYHAEFFGLGDGGIGCLFGMCDSPAQRRNGGGRVYGCHQVESRLHLVVACRVFVDLPATFCRSFQDASVIGECFGCWIPGCAVWIAN